MCLPIATMKIQIILATYVIILTRLVTQGSSSLSVGSSGIISTLKDLTEPTSEVQSKDEDSSPSRLQKRGVLAAPYSAYGFHALSIHPPSRVFVTYPQFVPFKFPIRPLIPFPTYFGYPFFRYPHVSYPHVSVNLEPPLVPTPGVTLVPPIPPSPAVRLLP